MQAFAIDVVVPDNPSVGITFSMFLGLDDKVSVRGMPAIGSASKL